MKYSLFFFSKVIKMAKITNKVLWDKEVKRLQRFINRLEKRGYYFDESIIPEKPKRVSKQALSTLQRLKGNRIYVQANYINPQTGEVLSGIEGKKVEKQLKSEYQQSIYNEADIILSNIIRLINEWYPQDYWSIYFEEQKRNDKDLLLNMLDEAIAIEGREETARRLQANSNGDLERLTNSILYSSDEDQVNYDIVVFASYLKGGNLSLEENIELTERQVYGENN